MTVLLYSSVQYQFSKGLVGNFILLDNSSSDTRCGSKIIMS